MKPSIDPLAHESVHIRLEPEQFYWARIDAASLGRNPSARSLGYLFETVLPVPIDAVHAVYRAIDRQIYIACGIEKHQLEERIQCAPLTLSPANIPEYLKDEGDISSEQFNLLTGPYTPRPVRQLQSKWFACAGAFLLLLSAILVIGLERRAVNLNRRAEDFRGQQSQIATVVFGKAANESPLPPALQLTAELRELRSTRNVNLAPLEQPDAARTLADLLTHWPNSLRMQTNSMTITGESISIQADLNQSSDVQQLAEALEPMDSWSLRQPRVDASSDTVRATIQLAKTNSKNPAETRP